MYTDMAHTSIHPDTHTHPHLPKRTYKKQTGKCARFINTKRSYRQVVTSAMVTSSGGGALLKNCGANGMRPTQWTTR